MRKLLAVVSLLTVLGGAGVAYGAALPPAGSEGPAGGVLTPLAPFIGIGAFPIVTSSVIGEGRALNSGCLNFNANTVAGGNTENSCGVQHLDWYIERLADVGGQPFFEFRYQIENSSTSTLKTVSINGIFTSISGDATQTNDLDITGPHVIASGEHETAIVGHCCSPTTPLGFVVGDTVATWSTRVNPESSCLAGTAPNRHCESGVMTGFGFHPKYENWVTQDGVNWSSSQAACTADITNKNDIPGLGGGTSCITVPSPSAIPSPASLFLVGAGVIAIGAVARRRFATGQ